MRSANFCQLAGSRWGSGNPAGGNGAKCVSKGQPSSVCWLGVGMNRTLGWIISLILFVLLGAIGVYTPAFNSSLKQVQTTLTQEAQTALATGNHDIWANIRVDGQTVILSGTAPTIAARDEAIQDIMRATGQAGPILGGIARINTSQTRIAKAPLLQDPYRFRADYQANFVKYDYHVPNEIFRAWINNLAKKGFSTATRQYDQTILAKGMPDESWPQAIVTVLTALSELDRGYVYTEGKVFKLTGISDSVSETRMREIFTDMPVGYSLETDLMLQNIPVTLQIDGLALSQPVDWDDQFWRSMAQPDATPIEQEFDVPRDFSSNELQDTQAPPPDSPAQAIDEALDGLSGDLPVPTPQSDQLIPTRTTQPEATNSGSPELKIPAPSQVTPRSKTPQNNLPPRPIPKDAFSGDRMKIETTPLAITPRRVRPTSPPRSGPSIKAKQTFEPEPVGQPSEAVASSKAATIPTPTIKELKPNTANRALAMPITYLPPRLNETSNEKSARDCQNEVAMILQLQNIEFLPTGSQMTPASRPLVAALNSILKRCDQHRIDIIGHTDNIGDMEENLVLSRERAEAVAQYFIKNGVRESALITAGFGETQPLTNNDTARNRKRNRRVEIVISTRGA